MSKGSLSMGVCDSIDAPCAYLTILRDPLERFMSHYVYSCLEGSEDRHTWDAEWIADASAKGYAQNGCPLSPVEFHSRVGGMINILAPGANPTTRCAVEAAKRNLRSPCVRFLLLDDLEHGLTEMRRTLPDFSEIGLSEQRSGVSDSAFWETNSSNSFGFGDQPTRRNQSGDKLDAAKKKTARGVHGGFARDDGTDEVASPGNGGVRLRETAVSRAVGRGLANVLGV